MRQAFEFFASGNMHGRSLQRVPFSVEATLSFQIRVHTHLELILIQNIYFLHQKSFRLPMLVNGHRGICGMEGLWRITQRLYCAKFSAVYNNNVINEVKCKSK